MNEIFLVNDLREIVNYTKHELTQEVNFVINSASERGYNLSDIDSTFVLQDITGRLNEKEFNVSDKVLNFIDNLLK